MTKTMTARHPLAIAGYLLFITLGLSFCHVLSPRTFEVALGCLLGGAMSLFCGIALIWCNSAVRRRDTDYHITALRDHNKERELASEKRLQEAQRQLLGGLADASVPILRNAIRLDNLQAQLETSGPVTAEQLRAVVLNALSEMPSDEDVRSYMQRRLEKEATHAACVH